MSNLLQLKVAKHASNVNLGIDRLATRSCRIPEALGNNRWTSDLIISTYHMAKTGTLPEGLNYKIGASNGGFDRLTFQKQENVDVMDLAVDDFSLELKLNRRSSGPQLSSKIPTYGGGMSFGSISLNFMLARAKAAQTMGSFTSTGEGGYPHQLMKYKDNVITQVATGLFGVREETIMVSPMIEFKYAQGAKPGLGGHLLADKVTDEVARMRDAVEFSSLFSPSPFHSVYSVEDHKKHVDWVKTINPNALISVKVSTPLDIDMVAIGSYFAGANIIHLDGAFGGTGAAPEIAKKNIAMPIEFAIPRVHKYLESEGVRDEITLIASGGIRGAYDVAKAIALGADGCVIGTAENIAVGCTHCGNCERGRGCQIGICSSDPELSKYRDIKWSSSRIENMYRAWNLQYIQILAELGLKSISDLRGRTDLLRYGGK